MTDPVEEAKRMVGTATPNTAEYKRNALTVIAARREIGTMHQGSHAALDKMSNDPDPEISRRARELQPDYRELGFAYDDDTDGLTD